MVDPDELALLQTLRLKGRSDRAALATILAGGSDVVDRQISALSAAGLLAPGETLRLTAAGRQRCAELLAAERSGVNAAALSAGYRGFEPVNRAFKSLVTEWQLNPDGVAGHLLQRLAAVHADVLPVVDAAAAELPRLSRYTGRLQSALDRIAAGDLSWLARPTVDSYHTVWFELHAELRQACGLTRRTDDE